MIDPEPLMEGEMIAILSAMTNVTNPRGRNKKCHLRCCRVLLQDTETQKTCAGRCCRVLQQAD